MSTKNTYRYRFISVKQSRDGDLLQALNQAGAQGERVVSVTFIPERDADFFSRGYQLFEVLLETATPAEVGPGEHQMGPNSPAARNR